MKLKIISFAILILSTVASANAIAAPQRHDDHGRGHDYGHDWHQPRVSVGVGLGVYDQPVYGDGYYNVYPTYSYPAYGWGYDHDRYRGDYGHDFHGGYHDEGRHGDHGRGDGGHRH